MKNTYIVKATKYSNAKLKRFGLDLLENKKYPNMLDNLLKRLETYGILEESPGYIQIIGNASCKYTEIQYIYDYDTDLSIITGKHVYHTDQFLGFKIGEGLMEGFYLGISFGNYLTDKPNRNARTFIFRVQKEKDKENTTVPLQSEVDDYLDRMCRFLDKVISPDYKFNANRSKIKVKKYEPIEYRETYVSQPPGGGFIKADIKYLIELAYEYHASGIHKYYITKDLVHSYAVEISQTSDRVYSLIDEFIKIAITHAIEIGQWEIK